MMESALSDPSCSRDLLLLEPVLKAGSTELLRLQAQFENDAADSDLTCAEQHLANLAESPISGIDDSDGAAAVARTTTTPDSFLAKLGEIGTSTAVPPNWKKQLCKVELQDSANELQGLRFVSCVPAEVQLPDHPREESTSTHHEYIIESNAAGIILRKQKDPQLGVIDILHHGPYSPQLENSNSKGLLQLDLGLVTRFHEAAGPLRSRGGAAGRLIRKRKREEACEDEEWLELGLSTPTATPSAAIENFCSSTLAGSDNNHQHRNSGLQIMSESVGEEMHPHEHEQDFPGQHNLHHSPVQTARIENLLDLFDTSPRPRSQPITAICSGGRMLLQTTTSLQSPKTENAIQLSWRDHVLQKREQLISCQEDPWQKLLLQSCVGNNVQQRCHTEGQPVHPVVSSSNLPEKHRKESREMMMNSDPVPWSDPSGNSSCAPPQETSRTTSARGGDRNRELWFTLRAAAAENRTASSSLRQIPITYIHVRNENVTVSSVQKYVALKLKLSSKTEVKITCKGQELGANLRLHQVHNRIWQEPARGKTHETIHLSGTTADKFPSASTLDGQLLEGKTRTFPDGSVLVAQDVVMVLTYSRLQH